MPKLILYLLLFGGAFIAVAGQRHPNVLIIVADQWRAKATGYAGNEDVQTPHLDALAKESVRFNNAVSSVPVCSPFRASLLTGQRALTHGVFLNDVPLNPDAVTIGKIYKAAGYDTAFVGKWHINGDGRSAFIPRERRQGFDYWKVLECTHNYTNSFYYGDTPEKKLWPGYDAIAQTRDAQNFLRAHASGAKPFLFVLAWGPPHNPYNIAPEQFRKIYEAAKLHLRGNVPPETAAATRRDLAGYYAHCSALDACIGELSATMKETGLDENTIVLFTSDHGDMLGSHQFTRKQKPWDESIKVPLLIHWPKGLGRHGRDVALPIDSEDLMPTLLDLSGIKIPKTVEGISFVSALQITSTLPVRCLCHRRAARGLLT